MQVQILFMMSEMFMGPQPYPSWILNEDTCRYDPPKENQMVIMCGTSCIENGS